MSFERDKGRLWPTQIPHPRRVVIGRRHHMRPVGAEGCALDRAGVASRRRLPVPQPCLMQRGGRLVRHGTGLVQKPVAKPRVRQRLQRQQHRRWLIPCRTRLLCEDAQRKRFLKLCLTCRLHCAIAFVLRCFGRLSRVVPLLIGDDGEHTGNDGKDEGPCQSHLRAPHDASSLLCLALPGLALPLLRLCLASKALMFVVKRRGAVERPVGGIAVGEKDDGCTELGAELKTTDDPALIRGVGCRLPCLRLGAFLGLEDGRRARARPHNERRTFPTFHAPPPALGSRKKRASCLTLARPRVQWPTGKRPSRERIAATTIGSFLPVAARRR